ncbi:NUDIX domain-containing protein [uncultured Enterovirga sp.]|uniref:NUDIX domain-containing protein n=1 Tax=uncultured Enterovirga sp. TaxID=2026352 RepID=UPI0035CC9F44
MPKRSAGLLLYRQPVSEPLELLLVHPGGPFWAKRDLGAWSIPKGEYLPPEDPLAAACREFQEETGAPAPEAARAEPLGDAVQAAGKVVTAFAVPGDLDVAAIRSNTFRMEWPPRSGQWRDVPEIDRGGWFQPDEARRRIIPGQAVFVDRLLDLVRAAALSPSSG